MNLIQALMYDVEDSIIIQEFWIPEDKFKLIKNEFNRIENDRFLCTRKKDVLLEQLTQPQIIKYWLKEITI